MNWVSIDENKCNDCGLCAVRCSSCFSYRNGKITVDANIDTCNICGHCISLCPTFAIAHQKMDMNNFPPVEKRVLIDTNRFSQFIRQRRSHRHFKEQSVKPEDLEKLIDICRYAPTGSNRQAVEIKIVQNKKQIKRYSDLTIDYFENIIKHIEKQVEQERNQGRPLSKELEVLHTNVKRYKPFIAARETGVDIIFRQAPCVLIFHSSPQKATTPKDDCVIAAHTVALLSITMGIETCFIGLFATAANAYLPIIEALSLPPHHQVYSVLILGYPKLKYLHAVDRTPISTTWE